ncbi:hypothetical protein [Kitasatospora albolonga]|uniref:hypothetical protein n=1 Tax=Kitasatospora albolonga TaxID=68173 RepID=UPI0031EB7146
MDAQPTTVLGESTKRLARILLDGLPELTEETVRRIREELKVYQDAGPLPSGQLHEAVRDNLAYSLRGLTGEEITLEAPRVTGRRRAEQGVPLAMVQTAYRLGFRCLWERMVAEAERTGAASSADLVAMASEVWRYNDEVVGAMVDAFNERTAALKIQWDQERSALVDVVLRGGMGNPGRVLEAADMLTLPYDGTFAVVVAHAPGLARQALPDIEPALRSHQMGSAWRPHPRRPHRHRLHAGRRGDGATGRDATAPDGPSGRGQPLLLQTRPDPAGPPPGPGRAGQRGPPLRDRLGLRRLPRCRCWWSAPPPPPPGSATRCSAR